jgi:DNA-binding NarL/FixJ family response regulator
MSRILIADDHPMVRAGLRALLSENSSIAEIAEAPTGQQVFETLRSSRWDLLILDISMPDLSGVDILREVRTTYPAVKVLILSIYPERQYALNVLKAGASGYLPKECAPEDLLTAVRTILSGRRYVTPETAELLATDFDPHGDKPMHARLSEREFQIFCKLATGTSVTEIGQELGISVKTVSTYRSRILEKMSLTTNADMTTYALRNELVN